MDTGVSALVFTNFGGIAPRVPARRLGDEYAQVNRNLLASAQEFRPLLDDRDAGAAQAGAKTLYRLEHRADGSLNSGDAEGWMTFADERSYAKGQLNDDATERTVYTRDDGTQWPRVMDAKGTDRPLGVPAPAGVTLALNEVGQFTQADAEAWIDDELAPLVAQAILASASEWHWKDGAPLAGCSSSYGMVQNPTDGRYGEMLLTLQQARERGLYGVVGYERGGQWAVPLQCSPKWGLLDEATLRDELRLLESPRDGSQLLSDERIASLASSLAARFDPRQAGIATARQRMDAAAQDFVNALNNAGIAAQAASNVSTRPQEPAKPTVAEYYWNSEGQTQRRQEWIDYDAAMAQYREALAAWEENRATQTVQASSSVAAVQSAQAAATAAHDEIYAYYQRLLAQLGASSGAELVGLGDGGQLFEVDPDRIMELRYYVATYVTDWGWESAPSPLSEALELDQNDTVTVTVPAPPAGYGITHWRLYRSSAGTNEAAFLFVDEMLATTRTYQDTVPVDGLGEVCPTWGWAMPPFREDKESAQGTKPPRGADPYLRGAVAMPNGIIAGFIDNFVAFCDPYHPYAWPVEYQITTEHPIVGLGVFGQTLFVGTMGYPYFISGSDSASMSAQKLAVDQPCISRRSIVALEQGVVYASPDGLCLASAAGVQLVTAGLFAREDWQALQPAGLVAAAHEGVYYFWAAGRAFALDVASAKLSEIDAQAEALHRDVLTDGLYAVVDGRIRRLFAEGRRTGHWKSRIVQGGRQEPFAWIQVDGEQDAAAPAVVRWHGDGALRYEVSITDDLPHRLPPGRWREHELELESAARITALRLASTTAELQQV